MRIFPLLACLLALLPAIPAGAADHRPQTRLEHAYSERAGTALNQFGYDLFTQAPPPVEPALGMVADEQLLGVGDEITVVLRGQTSGTSRYQVGSDGMLTIDELLPLPAAGRTLGAVRAEIEAAVADAMVQTRAFVSLSQARRAGVLVLGQVRRPGRQELPAFASILDGLLAAGGVLPEGSLRAIRLLQPGESGPGAPVDLYDLLETGQGAATGRLGNGARLLVPPLGATVAVAGSVRRPGIYELPPGGRPTVAQLLMLAGGPLHPAPPRLTLLGYGADGSERAVAVEDPAATPVGDGDLILVAPRRDDRKGVVMLTGHVRQPGPRPLAEAPELSSLVADSDLKSDAYRPLAVLAGTDPRTGTPSLHAVGLGRVLDGSEDRRLTDQDRLVVLGREDVAWLGSRRVLSVLAGNKIPIRGCAGLEALAATLTADPQGGLAASPLAAAAKDMTGPDLPCPPLFQDQPELVPFLLAHAVMVRHGVLHPGPYPAAPGVPAADLAGAAGAGALPGGEARPGQIIDADAAMVELAGAVTRPGRVPLAQARTLRDLLADGRILATDAYGLLAVLDRTAPEHVGRSLLAFAPADVLAGKADRSLRDGDRVLILDRAAVRRLTAAAGRSAPEREEAPPVPGPGPAQELERTDMPLPGEEDLTRFLAAHLVQVRGAVVEPGAYPVADPVPLAHLLQAAGGLARHADPDLVEVMTATPGEPVRRPRPVADPAGITLSPGDSVRIGARFRPGAPDTATLVGEVVQPGTYDIMPGEKLSALLARAGGLTAQAYPAGAIFTRESARRAEEEGLRRAARAVDQGLAQALLRSNPPDAARVELARALADDLRGRRALGRITVEADPAALAARPELDIVLEPGDRILIPRRPLTVTVAGEVLSPASLQFVPEKEADDYIREAGGVTRAADHGRAFLIYPDGSAQPLSSLPDRHGLEVIPPGSVVVVPRDPDPFEFLPIAQGVTTILGQLALTAAAIASLDDD